MEQFTYVKRGYDPEEVDRYIATLEQVIKSYKEKDNAIKNAIISAQVAADNMIKNAKAQADEYKGQIAKELDKVTLEIDRQRMRIQAFQDVYMGMVRKYLQDLDDKEMGDLYSRLDDVEKLVNRLKDVDITPSQAGQSPLIPEGSVPVTSTPPAPPTLSAPPMPPPSFNPPKPPTVTPSVTPGAPPTPPPGMPPMTSPPPPKGPPGFMGGNPPKPGGYAPPQVIGKINDDGNYVPNS